MDFELVCFQMFVGSARKWGRGCNHTYMFNSITKNVDEFLNEVEAMARIHHRNILQLKVVVFSKTNSLCMNLLKITWQMLFLVIL